MAPSTTYLLLLESDLNRVFGESVGGIAAAELTVVGRSAVDDAIDDIELHRLGRSQALRFRSDAPSQRLAAIVGQLSAAAALFEELEGPGGTAPTLRPRPIDDHLTYGTDLATTQRYRGKTNERLTRAMLNLALAAAGIDPARPSGAVLDPLCGRGTTLNWALAYGLHATGIEIDRASLDHHRTFLETWAKRSRLPHKAVRHHPGNAEQRWLSLRVAPDRAALKADRGQRVDTFHGDGGDPRLPLRPGSFDAVVTDLPYGVQHGGRGESSASGRSGSTGPDHAHPQVLLERALPAWYRWLRPGGGLAVAWNTKLTKRAEMVAALHRAGFEPISTDPHRLAHTVDASIDRDVIVAHRRG